VVLGEYIDLLAYDAAFWMTGLYNPEYPVEDLGQLTLELSAKLRCLAICVLLAKTDSDTFHHNLIRSGIARIIYLRRCRNKGFERDHHCVSGRYEAFLDVVAASEFSKAKEIADLTPPTFQHPREDEDDFCYAQILHRLSSGRALEAEFLPLLARFDESLASEPSVRLALCNALVFRDQGKFDEAFNGLLTERQLKIENRRKRGQVEDPGIVAERYVYIEGLAMLRLAESRGLKTEPEYLFCPSTARLPIQTRFPGE
jgi:hypothetical protein